MSDEKNLDVQEALAKAIKRTGELHNNDKLRKQAEEIENNILEQKKNKFEVIQDNTKAKTYKSWKIGKWRHSLFCQKTHVVLQVKAGNEKAGFPGEIIKFSKTFNSDAEAQSFAEGFSQIPFWRAEEKGFIKGERVLID